MAQEEYTGLWKEVEALELEGKFKSASEIVDEIYNRAKRQGEETQLVKSFLYRSKFLMLLQEDAQDIILADIKEAINTSTFPVDAILKSIQAGMLEQYLARNGGRIRDRSQLQDSVIGKDYKSWDATTLVSNISDLYRASLYNDEGLKKISSSDFEEILTNNKSSAEYRPTLYDILAHRALAFYKLDHWDVNRPRDRFFLTDSKLFAGTDGFLKAKLQTADSVFSLLPAIRIYQELERFHISRDTLAYLDVLLSRLNFVKYNSPVPEREQYFLKTLSDTWDGYKMHAASGLVGYEMAQMLYGQTAVADAKNIPELSGKRIEAAGICDEVIARFPNSIGAVQCQLLLLNIERPTVDLEVEKYLRPHLPFLVKVTYRNLDSLFVTIYRDPDKSISGMDYSRSRDSALIAMLRRSEPLHQKDFRFSQPRDYFSYSTEIDLPELSVGHYVAVVSTTAQIAERDEILAFQELDVTGLALLSMRGPLETIFRVVSRGDGLPVSGAYIEINADQNPPITGQTDKDGIFRLAHPEKKSGRSDIRVGYEKDTITYEDYWLPVRYTKPDSEKEHRARTFLFLDRSIYRPGQTVYFKGILTEKKKGKSRVVPDTWVTVFITDTNGMDLKEFRLKTNDFGSVQGAYQLPRNLLTGEFTIAMDEDFNTAGTDDPYWHKIDDLYEAEVRFSVEEYKRPRFEIEFEKVTANLTLGDSITLRGRAEAYLGSSIRNAPVRYIVTRSSNAMPWNYRRQAPRMISEGEATTDRQGNFEISFLATPDSTILAQNNPVYTYTVLAELTDINGETRSAETSLQVGYRNLKVDLDLPDKWNRNVSNTFSVNTRNLNEQPIAASVVAKVFRLKAPEQVLREKPWSLPDFQILSKAVYRARFPHEPYDSTDIREYWPKAEEVFEWTGSIQGFREIRISDMAGWFPGRYQLEVRAADTGKDTLRVSRQFEVLAPGDKEAFPGGLFQSQVVNTDFRKDRYVQMKFSTAAENLTVYIDGYCGQEQIESRVMRMERGSHYLKIPVRRTYKHPLVFNVYYVKFNSLFSEQIQIDLPRETDQLAFETLSFRNKIIPDQQETWSFRIADSQDKGASAEALATMYDVSLDQFKKHFWRTNLSFQETYYRFYVPRVGADDSFTTRNFSKFNYVYPRVGSQLLRNYRDLNWFGFDFADSQYSNKRYLRQLETRVRFAQTGKPGEGNISGFISDEYGYALPGANVVVNGSAITAQTDFDGYYSMDAPIGSSLTISYPGYQSEIVWIRKSGSVNVVLREDGQALNEVVATAQGIKRESSALGYAVSEADEETVVESAKVVEEALQVKVRSDMKETAFFFPQLRTDKNGVINLEFTSPQALTKWRLMLFAHTRNLEHGALEKFVITQKDISIVPNYPRFVREKDTLYYSAKISNLTAETLKGVSVLEIRDAMTMDVVSAQVIKGEQNQTFQLAPKASAEVTWMLTIPKGMGPLQIKTVAKAGQKSDGEVKIIPVLSNRVLVSESKPIWVPPGAEKSVTLENLKTHTSGSINHHRFTLEYTSNPAWLALKSLPYLMDYPYECAEQTFARYYSNAIAESILESHPGIESVFKSWASDTIKESPLEKNPELKSIVVSESPWLRDAESEKENNARLGRAFAGEGVQDRQAEAIATLRQLQLPSGGFPWFAGGRENRYITRHIIAGFGHLAKLGIESANRDGEEVIIRKALDYLDGEFIADHKKRLEQGPGISRINLYRSDLHYLYMRSFFLDHYPLTEEERGIVDQYLKSGERDWLTYSVYEKGMVALALHRFGKPRTAGEIMEALGEQAVYSEENGMYWKENEPGWYWYEAPVEIQSLLIEAFSEITEDVEKIDQLKLWLLKNKRTHRWETTKATTEAVYALLMRGGPWLSLSHSTTLNLGDQEINPDKLNSEDKEAKTGYFKRTWKDGEITSDMATLKVANKGEVSGFGAVYWQYFEDVDQIVETADSPLKITKGLYLKNQSASGTTLSPVDQNAPLKVGDLLTVRLEITARESLEFIHLKDLRGSGLEPVDVLSEYKWQDGLGYYQSTKDVATHFFFDRLPKGTYVFEYDLRVNNAGNFSSGISNIQSMYAPEFSGHSDGRRLNVLRQ